jgi:antitoxin VapB
MIEVDSKTFKSGNSEAVRLPKEVAFGPGVDVTIRKTGNRLTIEPKQIGPPPGPKFRRQKIVPPKREGI